MKYIIFELPVILFLVIGVDYLPLFICWIPFIIYNYLYIGKIADYIEEKFPDCL